MGSLSWQGAGKTVTSPIAVRPQSVVAAKDVFLHHRVRHRLRRHQRCLRHQQPDQHDPGRPVQGGFLRRGAGPRSVRSPGGNRCLDLRQDGRRFRPAAPLAKFSVISSDPDADFDMWVVNPARQRRARWQRRRPASRCRSPTRPRATYTDLREPVLQPGRQGHARQAWMRRSSAPTSGNATLTPSPLRLANGKSGVVTMNWKNLAAGSYIGRVTFAGASEPTFVSVLVIVRRSRRSADPRTRTATTVGDSGNNGKKGKRQEESSSTRSLPVRQRHLGAVPA